MAWWTGLPLLFRAETTDHAIARTATRGWIRDRALRILYRRFARVLYVGDQSLRHYQRLGVPEQALVSSPYCVDTKPFACDDVTRLELRDAARSDLGLAGDDIALMFVGKLSYRKGPDLLLEAVRTLPTPWRDRICVCFVGDGDMKADLETIAQAAPRVRSRFAGFQNQTRLSRYYHAADALVLPSRWGETWGLVVNEALHHGVPCVVSDSVGCASNLIVPGVTGHKFSTGSVASLAAALLRSLGMLGSADTRMRCRRHVDPYNVVEAARGVAAAYGAVTGATAGIGLAV